MMWTQKRKENPVKIYTASANEALALRGAILTGTKVNCKLRLADTCSKYEIVNELVEDSEVTNKKTL